jgi:hypothetical protein
MELAKQELIRATQAFEDDSFRTIMDIVRDKVSPEEREIIIEVWARTLVRTQSASWNIGYDSGYQVGKEFNS